MFCPFCRRNSIRVFKEDKVYCSRCDALVEDLNGFEMEKPTLKCPKCGHYSRNDYCSVCGFQFHAGMDY